MTWLILADRSDKRDTDPVALSKPAGVPGATAVPEESIFGIASRYHALTGHQVAGDTLIDLLGRRNVSLSTSFPSGLQTIYRRLALPMESVKELIDNHSVLPYFRPFTQAPQYSRIAQNVAGDIGRDVKISLGLLASRIGAQDILRYCPACAQADLDTIGVATWYRAHQLPGVLVCPYHGDLLKENYCLAHRLRRQQLFLPSSAGQGFSTCGVDGADTAIMASLRLIARLSAQILLLGDAPLNSDGLRHHYIGRLLDMGLASSLSRIRRRELAEEFGAFWAGISNLPPFSSLLACCHQEGSWLAGLCRKPRSTRHPLKHILLIGFLADDAASFFGARQWPSPVIGASKPLAKSSNIDDCEIVELLRDGASSRQIARALGWSLHTLLVKAERAGAPVKRRPKKVNDAVREQVRRALAAGDAIGSIMLDTDLSSATINRLLGGDRVLQRDRAASVQARRQSQARESLLAAITNTPRACFRVLRASAPAHFAWLYRNDRAWLRAHLPIPAQPKVNKAPVDWHERDLRTARRVAEVVAEILNMHGKPMRVTINEIARRTENPSWLGKHLGKLPATKAALLAAAESRTAFRERRIRWWEQELASPNICEAVAKWKIARAAGVPPSYAGNA